MLQLHIPFVKLCEVYFHIYGILYDMSYYSYKRKYLSVAWNEESMLLNPLNMRHWIVKMRQSRHHSTAYSELRWLLCFYLTVYVINCLFFIMITLLTLSDFNLVLLITATRCQKCVVWELCSATIQGWVIYCIWVNKDSFL